MGLVARRHCYRSQCLSHHVDACQQVVSDANRLDALRPQVVLLVANLPLLVARGFHSVVAVEQHLVEVRLLLDAATLHPDEETVPQRLQAFALCRQLIASSHQQLQWQAYLAFAIAEQLLVDHRQQRVLDGGPRFPYLVEEHHVGSWQIAVNGTLISV